ncbi:MAG TPA: lytic transglycosylase domain-containing protein [Symbiobacteriaceae bacterium]
MGPLRRSQVAAALVVLIAGLVSLLYEFGRVQGASADLAAHEVGLAGERVEQEAWASQRQQVRLSHARQLQVWEERSRAETALVAHRSLVHQQTRYQAASDPRVDDLVPEAYRRILLEVAAEYNIDPRLLAAVVTIESRWNARAVGAHQDSGLMQILPSTAEAIARGMGLKEYNIFDPRTNLSMGAWYLRQLYEQYGSWPQALAAYNGGPAAAQQGANHRYTQQVMAVYHQGA